MKLALIGYGKMGKEIDQVAREKEHEVTERVCPNFPKASAAKIPDAALKDVDVCIDFSTPDSVLSNIEEMAKRGKTMVVGTTGWDSKLDHVKEIVDKYSVGFMYSPNFSIGVNVFMALVEKAAKLMDQWEDYDVSGFEAHHNQKVDSPSGTAKGTMEILLANLSRKTKPLYDCINRKIEPEEIHFPTLRCGSIAGTHSVLFDSVADSVELKVTAKNRRGYAMGAVKAAEWMQDKKGFYSMDDFLNALLKGE